MEGKDESWEVLAEGEGVGASNRGLEEVLGGIWPEIFSSFK